MVSVLVFILFLFHFQELPLDKYSKEECNNLLIKLGFFKKDSREEELSEEKKGTLRYKRMADFYDDNEADEQKEEL